MMSKDRLDLVACVERQLRQVELLLAFIEPLISWQRRQGRTRRRRRSRTHGDHAPKTDTSIKDAVYVSDDESAAVSRLRQAHLSSLQQSAVGWRNRAEQVRQSYADAPRDPAPDGDLIDALLNSGGLIALLAQLLDALAASFQAQTSPSPQKAALLRRHVKRWRVEVWALRARIDREKADDSAERLGVKPEFAEAERAAIRRALQRHSGNRKR
jgi:hypothetical protein